ncbi:MAG TPA: glycosyltransferase family 2 protein [Burkholderiaceae bacterium]|nr:glycosyltransferase family 2 protein [Burkholderiaceae bacterium]
MNSSVRSSEASHGESASGLPLVSAVIPCLNEEGTLALCINKAQASFAAMGVCGEVVIADNGSTDRSREIATSLGARVVIEQQKGYGAALRRGITEARGSIIVMADADDSYDWSAIAPFVQKIQQGYDLVLGNRFAGGIMPGAMPPLHRYLGNPVLSWVARRSFGVPIRDFHCGMRAFTRQAFEKMMLQTPGMEFATEMVANAAHQGLRIGEIPIVLHPDKRGRPPHLRSFRDGWRHLRFILTYAPDYTFLAPGILMLLAGLVLQAVLIMGPVTIGGLYLGIHFLALGCLLALAGFNIFNLGVFAKTLLAQRYDGFRSRTARWVEQRFSLDAGIVAGGLLLLAGITVDGVILYRWLSHPGLPMDSTVHPAFVATSMIALGINIIVSSLLLNLIVSRGRSGE